MSIQGLSFIMDQERQEDSKLTRTPTLEQLNTVTSLHEFRDQKNIPRKLEIIKCLEAYVIAQNVIREISS